MAATTTRTHTATPPIVVPDVAIRWILKYSCTSNCALSALSNVNRQWRSTVHSVFDEFLNAVVRNDDNDTFSSEYSLLSSLLLPEMAVEKLRRSRINEYNPSSIMTKETPAPFCLAWFAPSGIKVQAVHPKSYNEDELFSSSSDSGSSKDEDENDEMCFYRQRFQHTAHDYDSNSMPEDVVVDCCYEWQGYRSAIDVLLPLGYATMFIKVRNNYM